MLTKGRRLSCTDNADAEKGREEGGGEQEEKEKEEEDVSVVNINFKAGESGNGTCL